MARSMAALGAAVTLAAVTAATAQVNTQATAQATTRAATRATSRATTQSASPDADPAWRLLSGGDQSAAEAAVGERLHDHPNNAATLFFAALLTRSRFDVDGADPLFRRVVAIDPQSDLAAASDAIVSVDHKDPTVDAAFDVLQDLVKKHPDDGKYPWLLAIACRTARRNALGAAAFEQLGHHFQTGPVLFHQTYANVLDDLGRYADALPHRRAAIKLEPETWTYEGLGDTYGRMQKWPEATAAYTDGVKHFPDAVRTLLRLGNAAYQARDADGCLLAGTRLTALRPKASQGYLLLSTAYALKNDLPHAADAIKTATELDPSNADAKAVAVRLLRAVGRNSEADTIQKAPVAARP